ncbi:hypothetical protein N752_09760 [Desulforamulus aquiferis]|nr:hypothetical protein [Desulforamulus aquiferis]RYD05373.1 hypothetical protein N752_09760 [Desulforamulus aquiferis]
MLEGVVYTDLDKCKECSACLQVCETKSIRFEDGKGQIIKAAALIVVCVSTFAVKGLRLIKEAWKMSRV